MHFWCSFNQVLVWKNLRRYGTFGGPLVLRGVHFFCLACRFWGILSGLKKGLKICTQAFSVERKLFIGCHD
jgi:hypothetical protein